MDPFVSVQSLSKSYGQGGSYALVLDNVSLSIAQGSICVIQGTSGSGKSTLLNCIGALDHPDAGHIQVADVQVTSLKRRALTDYRRLHVGFIFQFYNLVPNLTVWENIQVCEQLSNHPLAMPELVDVLGLTDHRDKFPAQLSGGQQQRCAIARALVKRPQLILCDEPTGALDYATSIDVLHVLEEINQVYAATICMVTHNSAISLMAHQVVKIKDGRIIDDVSNPAPSRARSLTW